MTPAEASAELLRRRYGRNSLVEFSHAIDVPGKPVSEDDDEWVFSPVETKTAKHHVLIMDTLEKVFTGEIKNLMIFAPPGSAKSSFASVVFPAYALGKRPGMKIILASYASAIAWKQSRRTRQIVKSAKYRKIFDTAAMAGNASVEEWALDNKSEYMAGGLLAGMTGNRANCFVAGTRILSMDGVVPIESVTPDSYVLAYDHATESRVWRRVRATRRNKTDDLVEVHTAAGRVLVCTADHPIYVAGKGYTQAGLLGAGDALIVFGLPSVQRPEVQGVEGMQGVLRQSQDRDALSAMRVLRKAGDSARMGVGEARQEQHTARLLQQVLSDHVVQQISAQEAEAGIQTATRAQVCGQDLPDLLSRVSCDQFENAVLLEGLLQQGSLAAHDGFCQLASHAGSEFQSGGSHDASVHSGAGRGMRSVSLNGAAGCASHRREPGEQRAREFGGAVQRASHEAPQEDAVSVVRRVCGESQYVYDLDVEGVHNFFAGEVLVHNCIIIDDPVAGREDAESETLRRKTREAYEDDLKTRLIPGGSTIMILTRWHESDLAGHILPENWNGESGDILCRDGQTWHVLCIPAIAEREDDPLGRPIGGRLWPEWFTEAHFDQFRANPRTWMALFQQRPRPAEGAEFKISWLQRYGKAPRTLNKIITVDPSSGKRKDRGDYTSMWVIGLAPDGNRYILDCVRDRLNLTERTEALFKLHRKWKPLQVRYEQYGLQADIESIKAEQERQQYRFQIQEVGGALKKEDRIRRLIPLYQYGQIYHPTSLMYRNTAGEDIDLQAEYEKEFAAFPVARHDDMMDSLARMEEPSLSLPFPTESYEPDEYVSAYQPHDSMMGL